MKIIIQRKKAFIGWAVCFDLYLDGQKIGSVKNGEEYAFEASPGLHELACKTPLSGRFKMEINVPETGENMTVQCGPNYGLIHLSPCLLFLPLLVVPILFLLGKGPDYALFAAGYAAVVFVIYLIVQYMVLKPILDKYGWLTSTCMEMVPPG